MADSVRVAILRGGIDGERDVSLLSGTNIRDAAKAAGYAVVDVVVEPDGTWSLDGAPATDLLAALARLKREVDLVFPVLHGRFGEDGVLQGALEAARIPYFGCGVTTSSVAMDKILSRRVAGSIGLEIAPGVEGGPDRRTAEIERIASAARGLAFPVFVKPACSGSSVGVTRVSDPGQLVEAISTALEVGGRVVIESSVVGQEVSCPVIGDAGLDRTALPVIAIVPKGHEFFDYQAKYTTGHCDEICPAPIPEELTKRLQAAAIRVHDALLCTGVSRSDFIVREDGSFVFLEVNTMPGMSQYSLVPKSLAAAGISMATQVKRWIESALAQRGNARR